MAGGLVQFEEGKHILPQGIISSFRKEHRHDLQYLALHVDSRVVLYIGGNLNLVEESPTYLLVVRVVSTRNTI